MSVPVGQRNKCKLDVLVKAKELAKYTLNITKNNKVFLPEYQTALTDDIIRSAKDIYIHAWVANIVKVTNKDNKESRLKLQEQAIYNSIELLALIELAKNVYHLKSKRAWFWADRTINVRNLIREWHSADIKRYSNIV